MSTIFPFFIYPNHKESILWVFHFVLFYIFPFFLSHCFFSSGTFILPRMSRENALLRHLMSQPLSIYFDAFRTEVNSNIYSILLSTQLLKIVATYVIMIDILTLIISLSNFCRLRTFQLYMENLFKRSLFSYHRLQMIGSFPMTLAPHVQVLFSAK